MRQVYLSEAVKVTVTQRGNLVINTRSKWQKVEFMESVRGLGGEKSARMVCHSHLCSHTHTYKTTWLNSPNTCLDLKSQHANVHGRLPIQTGLYKLSKNRSYIYTLR